MGSPSRASRTFRVAIRSPAVSARVPSRSKTSMGGRSVMPIGVKAEAARIKLRANFSKPARAACVDCRDQFADWREKCVMSQFFVIVAGRRARGALPGGEVSLQAAAAGELRISGRAADRPQPRLPPRQGERRSRRLPIRPERGHAGRRYALLSAGRGRQGAEPSATMRSSPRAIAAKAASSASICARA